MRLQSKRISRGEGGGMCHLFNEKIIAGTNNMQIVSI